MKRSESEGGSKFDKTELPLPKTELSNPAEQCERLIGGHMYRPRPFSKYEAEESNELLVLKSRDIVKLNSDFSLCRPVGLEWVRDEVGRINKTGCLN